MTEEIIQRSSSLLLMLIRMNYAPDLLHFFFVMAVYRVKPPQSFYLPKSERVLNSKAN